MKKEDFCCIGMFVNSGAKTKLIRYSPHSKDYMFILHDDPDGDYLELDYCPWCGTKLPDSLDEKWCKIVKEKFGYDNVFAEEWAKLPEEFKTDAWWKKRGL